MRNLQRNPFIKSILGGLLLSLAWWEHSTGLIMLVAFIPFLSILSNAKKEETTGSSIFVMVLPGFLLFNVITFSWLGKASWAGASLAILAHSFLMSLTLWLTYKASKKSGSIIHILSFISFWLAYEYVCLNLDIISPWLNTGNVFGKEPRLIQWYEITGTGGGTLWILISNILIYRAYTHLRAFRRIHLLSTINAALAVILPIFISLIMLTSFHEGEEKVGILIVQPNIDPFNEKFDSLPFLQQYNDMLMMAEDNVNESIDWLILPETAIDDPFYEESASSNKYVRRSNSFVREHQQVNIVTGATTVEVYFNPEIAKRGSLEIIENSESWYERFNSAMHIGIGKDPSFYHKSKLVPGIEKRVTILPPFLERVIVPELGGTMTGYGTQKDREVFYHSVSSSRLAPIICYESAYGEFTTEYVRIGADILAIITNDGWWKNSAGYKQHLWFASLRAIENRRSVVRAANTGISCIIDQRGIITDSLGWWEKGTLTSHVAIGKGLTFYSQHGDIIYKYFTIASIFLLILAFIASPLRDMKDGKKII